MSESDKPIKVVDRRLFTADGEVREDLDGPVTRFAVV